MGNTVSRLPKREERVPIAVADVEDGVHRGELVSSPLGGFVNMEEADMDEDAFKEGACEVMAGETQTGPSTLCHVPQEEGRMLRIELSGTMVVHAAVGKPIVVRFVTDE